MRNRQKLAAFTAVLFLAASPAGSASSITSTFQAKINIGSSCTVSATSLDFGSQGVLGANVDGSSNVTVACPTGTAYNVGLDQGVGAGATTSARYMSNAGAQIRYMLYTDAGRTSIWGNVVGADTLSGVGAGLPTAIPVYGRVPAQTTPAPGSYTDTITVTVTY